MTDEQLHQELNQIYDAILQRRDNLPRSEQCACDKSGHCLHHANVWNHLSEALFDLERAKNQLKYPNGAGDKAAW